MNNNIKKIIDMKGLKVTFIINKTGLARSAFYEIMNGNSVPSLLNARNICKALGENLECVFPNDDFSNNR